MNNIVQDNQPCNQLQTDNGVGIPLDQETFSKVILDFLGRKENLSYGIHENFILKLDDINQFHNIIVSKLSYQKNIYLQHLSIKFVYSDNSSREINSQEALQTYLETRPVDIEGVSMTWKIIIKFDNNPSIETQEINLIFASDIDSEILDWSYIKLSIDHTNQSWALDIMNAFKDKINEVTLRKSKLYKTYKKATNNNAILSLIITTFLALVVMLAIPMSSNTKSLLREDLVSYALSKEYSDESSKIINLLHITSLEKDEILEMKNNDKEIKEIIDKHNKNIIIYGIIIILAMITPFIIKWYIKYSVNYLDHKSFILLNNNHYDKLEKYRSNKNRTYYIGFTLITSSIIFSILATIIYNFINKIIF